MDNFGGEGLTMFVTDKDFYGQKVGLIMQNDKGGQVVYIGSNKIGESMINLDSPNNGRFSMSIDSSAISKLRHYDYQKQITKTLLESNYIRTPNNSYSPMPARLARGKFAASQRTWRICWHSV